MAVTVDHRLHGMDAYRSADDVSAAVAATRDLDGVDPDRIGLWFFSGSGPLAADWLADPPGWVR